MSKSKMFLIGVGVAALLGLVAVIMPLAPFVIMSGTVLGHTETVTIGGFDMIFGDYSNGGSITSWILLVLGVVLAIGALVESFLKNERLSALSGLLSGVVLVVGGVLAFFSLLYVDGFETVMAAKMFGYSVTLGVGAWIGGIASIIGGASIASLSARLLLKK